MISDLELAKIIYYAQWEMYPPDKNNPINKMNKDQAWEATNQICRDLALFQALKVKAAL